MAVYFEHSHNYLNIQKQSQTTQTILQTHSHKRSTGTKAVHLYTCLWICGWVGAFDSERPTTPIFREIFFIHRRIIFFFKCLQNDQWVIMLFSVILAAFLPQFIECENIFLEKKNFFSNLNTENYLKNNF